MNKKTIKIIKRNKKKEAAKPQIVIKVREIKSEAQLAKVINKWIFERNENRRMEKVFSSDKIFEWKSCSRNLKKDR